MDDQAAQFPTTQILVASEGLPRLEFVKDGAVIDTMHVHKFSADGLTEVLEEMGQVRDTSRSWEGLQAEQELFEAFIPQYDGDL